MAVGVLVTVGVTVCDGVVVGVKELVGECEGVTEGVPHLRNPFSHPGFGFLEASQIS